MLCNLQIFSGGVYPPSATLCTISFYIIGSVEALPLRTVKGERNPEMKLCELLVLGHRIHLPLNLFACASSGQSYSIGSPLATNFCDVIDTAMTGDPFAF